VLANDAWDDHHTLTSLPSFRCPSFFAISPLPPQLEQYVSSVKGKGLDVDEVKEKIDEAKLLLKKSKRKVHDCTGVERLTAPDWRA